MEFAIKDIRANPFRNIKHYPIQREKVEALRESLRTTGYWGNVVARVRDGKPEIAYGHHRLVALKEEYGPNRKVDLIIRGLDDTAMLQIMARENMEEWGTSAWVEQETVRSVVQAYAEGKIELERPGTNVRHGLRYAPSFLMNPDLVPGPDRKPYTAESVAKFIGWTYGPNATPQDKVHAALTALQFVEEGIASEVDFEHLTTKQAESAVETARKERRPYEDSAQTHQREAERAAAKAEEAGKAGNEKERAIQERVSRNLATKAQEESAKGRRIASAVIKTVSTKIRSGAIGYKEASRVAAVVSARTNKRSLPDIEGFARDLTRELNAILDPERDPKAVRLAELITFRKDLNESLTTDLIRTLEVVLHRVELAIGGLRGEARALKSLTAGKTKEAA